MMARVLIGGVGYRHLRDHSFGVVLVDALGAEVWPPHVSVEDLSYNPIAVVQRLQDDPDNARFDVAIVVGVLQRAGRAPGTLEIYRWDQALPGPGAIQEAITEAVTGIIALDNTLVVARHFDVLPPAVVVVELEPDAHDCGDELTPVAAAALGRAKGEIRGLALTPALVASLPEGTLGDRRVRHSGVIFEQVFHAAATRIE